MNKIPLDKWQQIYVALKLIKFYAFTTNNNSIQLAREVYNDFNNLQFPNDNERNQLDSIPNSLSLIYLLIVRTTEILVQYIDNELPQVKNEIWNQIRINLEVENFENVLQNFNIQVIDDKLPDLWKNSNETDKFFGFLSSIRNSISHWRYEIITPTIVLKDRKNKTAPDNFHIEIPYNQLLNFTDKTISIIHDYLKNDRLE